MTPPTVRPSTIYLEIDAERYFNDLRGAGFPMPDGCSAHGTMDVEEVKEWPSE